MNINSRPFNPVPTLFRFRYFFHKKTLFIAQLRPTSAYPGRYNLPFSGYAFSLKLGVRFLGHLTPPIPYSGPTKPEVWRNRGVFSFHNTILNSLGPASPPGVKVNAQAKLGELT